MRLPPIVLIGMSGNMLEIFEAVELNYSVKAILDDGEKFSGTEFEGIPILPLSRVGDFPEARFLFLIGSERSFAHRGRLVDGLGLAADRFATVVHPSARVSRFARLGRGVVLYQGVTITANATLGDHVMVLPHSVVHHDVTIGACSLVGSGVTLAGGCRIGHSCSVGSASSVRNGVAVGDGALVGMAANVVRDVAPGAVVAGNPARPLARSAPQGGGQATAKPG